MGAYIASALPKSAPNRYGPPAPKRDRVSAQIASIRAISAKAPGVCPAPAALRNRLIGMAMRNSRNPACISAAIDRAWARASGAEGHNCGAISAQYSQIASDSHTALPRCSRYGTMPAGVAAFTAGVEPPASGITTSSTSSRASRTGSQPRSDQDE